MAATFSALERSLNGDGRDPRFWIGTVWRALRPSLVIDNDPRDRIEVVGIAADGVVARPYPDHGACFAIDPARLEAYYAPDGRADRPSPPPLLRSIWYRRTPRKDAFDKVVIELVETHADGTHARNARPEGDHVIYQVYVAPVDDLDEEPVPIPLALLERDYVRETDDAKLDEIEARVRTVEARAS